MDTYQKINTLYKRYQQIAGKSIELPNTKYRDMQNQIIIGNYSNPSFGYLFNTPWEGYSKIDGTNSKIAFWPSSGKIDVGGKTDKATSQSGQFEFLREIANRIQPIMREMFPPSCAKFAPVKVNSAIAYSEMTNLDENIKPNKEGQYVVNLEEIPIYIYGEYYGKGIQSCGKRYIADSNDFRVFDINIQGWWLPSNMRNEYCEKLGLKQVPFLGIKTLAEWEQMVMEGFTTKVPDVSDPTLIEEGIVCRPSIPIRDTDGSRLIVKIKWGDYNKWKNARAKFSDEEFEIFNKWYSDNVETF